eukprot:gene12471-15559_t
MHFTLVALLLCNGLVDRPINAGEGDDCSKGEAQVQHIGVMIEALTCVEQVDGIATYRENDLVCDVVRHVSTLTFADRLAFYSCAAKETGDLLGGAGGIQVALDSVCDAGQSADALVSISLIRDCLITPVDQFVDDATAHFCQPLIDAWDCVHQAHAKSPCYTVDTATESMLQSYAGLCPITFPSYTITIDLWAGVVNAALIQSQKFGGYQITQQVSICQQISSKINGVDLCSGIWAISKEGLPFEPPTLRMGSNGHRLQVFDASIIYTKKGAGQEVVLPVQIYAENILISTGGDIYALQRDPSLDLLYPTLSAHGSNNPGRDSTAEGREPSTGGGGGGILGAWREDVATAGFDESTMSEADLLLARSMTCVDLLTPDNVPWTDVDNDGCPFYAAGSATACNEWGADFTFAANELTAKTACCGCGGGRMEFQQQQLQGGGDGDGNADGNNANFLEFNEYANGTCTEALVAKAAMCPEDATCVDTRAGDGHYCRPSSTAGRVSIAAAELEASVAALLSTPSDGQNVILIDGDQADAAAAFVATAKVPLTAKEIALIVAGSILSMIALVAGDVQLRHPGGRPSVQWPGSGNRNSKSRHSQFNDDHAAAAFTQDQPEWDTFNDIDGGGGGGGGLGSRQNSPQMSSPASRQLPPRPGSRAMMLSPSRGSPNNRRFSQSPMQPQQQRRGTPPFHANGRPVIKSVNFADNMHTSPGQHFNPMDRMMDAYMTLDPHSGGSTTSITNIRQAVDEAEIEEEEQLGSPARLQDFIARPASVQKPEVKRLTRQHATPQQQHYMNEQMQHAADSAVINDAATAARGVIHGGGDGVPRVSRAQLRAEWLQQKKASQNAIALGRGRGVRANDAASSNSHHPMVAAMAGNTNPQQHRHQSPKVSSSPKRIATNDSAEYAIADRPDEDGDAEEPSFSEFMLERERRYENAASGSGGDGNSNYHLGSGNGIGGRQGSDPGTLLANGDMGDQIYNFAAAGGSNSLGSTVHNRSVTKRRPPSYYAALQGSARNSAATAGDGEEEGDYHLAAANNGTDEGDYHLASSSRGPEAASRMLQSHISEGDYELAAAGQRVCPKSSQLADRDATDNTDATGADEDDVYDFATVPTKL